MSSPLRSGRANLVVVANRLPVRYSPHGDAGEWLTSPGGLVSALTAVLREHDGLWIGWPGTAGHEPPPREYEGIPLRAVDIDIDEYENFYLGFSNATLWPLYHDAIRYPEFHRQWWHAYEEVNRRYATAAAESAAEGGLVWVHDYQLQLVPGMLRALRPDLRIGFFLHIPFPATELFMQMPWRRQILEGILGADLVGFQVHSAALNFSRVARRLTSAQRDGTPLQLSYEGRRVQVGAFPISIDSARISETAADPAVRTRAKEIRAELGDPELVLLGVDRLDYTKGIRQRIKAVSELHADGYLVAGRDVMVQIAVPSRESDPHYDDARKNLEQSVSEANGDQGLVGRPIIHYLHQNVDFEELVALYLAADIMLVTPFRDGMNLVAKEYVMTRIDMSGRLVLSEFAGAAIELRDAFLVNPHDLEHVKEAIRSAKEVGDKEARSRMGRMRRRVLRRTVYDWADSFLAALANRGDETAEVHDFGYSGA
ncbi:MAG: trehalose-6-phosphate synthase [Acidobacteriota bacterium]|nr:trehalose-6-phosphate synthase [Acidobacteriota bacterium]